jgi:hypothetical protein
MLDFLLGQGYQVKDSLKVPADLREIAPIRRQLMPNYLLISFIIK